MEAVAVVQPEGQQDQAATVLDTEDSAMAGSRAAYERFIGAASRYAPHEIIEYRGALPLAAYNYRRGLHSLEPERAKFEPLLSFDAFATNAGAFEAIAYLLTERRLLAPTASDAPALRKECARYRSFMLPALESVAELDDDDALRHIVATIAAGRGLPDLANDALGLAQAFAIHGARLAGRTVVTPEHVAGADRAGRALQAAIRPKGAAAGPDSPELQRLDRELDQVWTLLVNTHQQMRTAGVIAFGERGMNAAVPLLLSRDLPSRKPAKAPVPA